MTTNEQFERGLTAWLHDDAAFRVPDHLDEVLLASAATGQRSAWSSLERWLPVDTTFRPRLFNMPSVGRVLAVAALILILIAVAVFAIGSQHRLPAPFGLARNGIFLSSRDGDIYRIDPKTAAAQSFELGEGFDFSPIFSRDGTKFVFLRSDGPIAEPAILTLYVANADGSGRRALTPPTESLDWFDWSPDGTRVAYMSKGFLNVVAVAGGHLRLRHSPAGAVASRAAARSASVPRLVRRCAAWTARPTARISIEPLKRGSTKNGAPSWFRPATVTASTATASTVPQTLTRPGRIDVAPSSAAVKAGSRYSCPTELCPTCSCDCSTTPAKAASVPAATKPSVT